MKYVVVEKSGEWIVERDGEELGRFPGQGEALDDIAHRLRDGPAAAGPVSLAVRYEARG